MRYQDIKQRSHFARNKWLDTLFQLIFIAKMTSYDLLAVSEEERRVYEFLGVIYLNDYFLWRLCISRLFLSSSFNSEGTFVIPILKFLKGKINQNHVLFQHYNHFRSFCIDYFSFFLTLSLLFHSIITLKQSYMFFRAIQMSVKTSKLLFFFLFKN